MITQENRAVVEDILLSILNRQWKHGRDVIGKESVSNLVFYILTIPS